MVIYEFAHVGLHCPNKETTNQVAKCFHDAFAFPTFSLPKGVMASAQLEISNDESLIGEGHIGIYATPIDEAITDLQEKGYTLDMSTAKHNEGGLLQSVYLMEPFGAFKIHLLRKPIRE